MPFRAMLDTNIVSALMRDDSGALWEKAEAFGLEDLCTSVIVAGELRFGAYRAKSVRLQAEVRDILTAITVLPFGPGSDDTYGRIRAHLDGLGRPIGPNDLWIAVHALSLDLTLVTADTREFARVPGLKLENWLD